MAPGDIGGPPNLAHGCEACPVGERTGPTPGIPSRMLSATPVWAAVARRPPRGLRPGATASDTPSSGPAGPRCHALSRRRVAPSNRGVLGGLGRHLGRAVLSDRLGSTESVDAGTATSAAANATSPLAKDTRSGLPQKVAVPEGKAGPPPGSKSWQTRSSRTVTGRSHPRGDPANRRKTRRPGT